MSYEIYYGIEAIEQGGRIFPLIVHGSNNCYGWGPTGRQKRERKLGTVEFIQRLEIPYEKRARSFSSIQEFAAAVDYEGVNKEIKPRLTARGIIRRLKNPAHIHAAGTAESAVVNLYYCSGLTDEQKKAIFNRWADHALNPHRILEAAEEGPLFAAYLDALQPSLNLTDEARAAVLKYVGNNPFRVRAKTWALSRLTV